MVQTYVHLRARAANKAEIKYWTLVTNPLNFVLRKSLLSQAAKKALDITKWTSIQRGMPFKSIISWTWQIVLFHLLQEFVRMLFP